MTDAPAVIINLPGYPFQNLTSVDTIAALRARASSLNANGDNILVEGGSAVADGLGNIYEWSAASLAADNGGGVIRPTDTGLGAAGRYLRILGGSSGGVSIPSGIAGDGTTDNRSALAAYDTGLGSDKDFWLPAGTYRIASNLTVSNLVRFMRGAKIKPDAGVTVTFNGGVDADPFTQIFDVSNALSYCWAKTGRVTQYSYGALGAAVTSDDSAAFQHLVNNQLYIQVADIRPAEGSHKWATGVIINYGASSSDYRGVRWMGPGTKYGGSSSFGGLSIEYTGWENAIEVQGARAFVFDGTELRGPFIAMFTSTGFGGGYVPATDPNDLNNWIPTGANPLVLSRYKMCCGIHIDPRCGTKPTAANWAISTLYSFGTSVKLGGNLYVQYAYPSGTSASSGGPTGTSTTTAVTDGTCKWRYAGPDTTSIAYTDTVYPAISGASTQYNKPLSSRHLITNSSVYGFGVNIAVKGCDADGNADFTTLYNCQLNMGVFAFSWGHTQARLQSAISCGFGEAHTQISTAIIGRQTGENAFTGVNTQLGNCLQIVDMPNTSISGCVLLEGCYGEACNRIGNVRSSGPSGGSLIIDGGNYSFAPDIWLKVPESIVDCTGVLLSIRGGTSFSSLKSPFTIKGEPSMCQIEADISSPGWMTSGFPFSVTPAEAIMRRSTMDVVFVNYSQGPWTGCVRNAFQYTLDGATRLSVNGGPHATSNVSTPIPFCARTAQGGTMSGGSPVTAASNTPLPVALGGFQQAINQASISSYSQTGRIGTLTLVTTPTLSNAMNLGYEKGSVVYHLDTGNLYVITNRVAAVLTLKQLNSYIISTDAAVNPVAQPAGTGNWYFTPTGHYIPDQAYELTYTSSSATVTMALSTGGTTGSALQFPSGAVKAVCNEADAIPPVLRANTAISAVVDGTITLVGNARRTTVERAGLWFVPR